MKCAIIIFLVFVTGSFFLNDIDQPINFYILLCYSLFVLCAGIHAYFVNASKQGIMRKPYNRWYFCIAFIAISMTINYSTSFFPLMNTYSSYRIANDGNMPALTIGDRIIAKNIKLADAEGVSKLYSRGNFVIFIKPKQANDIDETVRWVKRIIAFPGEKLSIRKGVLYINEKPVREPYVEPVNSKQNISVNFASVTIPNGYVFVLGDNRDNSADSRYFGFVPINNLIGKVLYIYWSSDIAKIGKKVNEYTR